MSEKLIAWAKKNWMWILVALAALYLLTGVGAKLRRMRWRRLANATGEWDPYGDALILYEAMNSQWFNPGSWGSDEDEIFRVLEGKSPEQLVAIYNEFDQILAQNGEDGDLLSWLRDDLSGSELSRALGYFEGVTFT